MSRLLVKLGLCLALMTFSAGAFAQVRAWLDRDRINADESLVLSIQLEGVAGSGPNYGPLLGDFKLIASNAGTSLEPGRGGMVMRTLFLASLRPLRSGLLTIPSLQVNGMSTRPLSVMVVSNAPEPPQQQPQPVATGADVFMETLVDDDSPYVQQAVGLTVRLYSALTLVGGKLDQPTPQGASLTRVGDDNQYDRDISGRRYTIVERRFLLVPERSGPMALPQARFDGRSAPGLFDQLTGSGGDDQHARSRPRTLNVLAAPANAPQPWLPLRSVTLRYRSTPQGLRVGSAAAVVVEATIDGANAAQLPELLLPPIDGVQVFPEPVQADEGFNEGRPRVRLIRKFSLVPSRPGPVRVDGLRMDWWDVVGGAARSTTLPALNLTVTGVGGAAAAASNPGGAQATDAANTGAAIGTGATAASASPLGNAAWAGAALLFAVLWLITLFWALHLRGQPSRAPAVAVATGTAPAAAGARSLALNLPALKQLIDVGDFEQIATVLRSLARPPAADDDELVERLVDPEQREAVQALRRARWGGGDGVAARNQLRAAFARPPQWREVAVEAPSPLPPLYPPRG